MRISDWSADVCSSDLAYFVDVAGDERLRFHRFGMSAAINERRALQRLAVEDRKGVGAGKQIELLPPVNPAILNTCRVIARSRFHYRPPFVDCVDNPPPAAGMTFRQRGHSKS